jgi:Uncharacterized phage-associated protein
MMGPVVPDVYHAYKVCGHGAIFQDEDFDEDTLPECDLDALTDVMRVYGKYTTNALVDMTHRSGGAWSRVYNPRERDTVIPLEFMAASTRPEEKDLNFPIDEILSRIPIIPTTRTEDGVIIIPKEFHDGEWSEI